MASIDVSTVPTNPPIDAKAAATPRKRRRRTAATGAADDCFACRKRQSKCDRKRPYCSQCLEVGKECSGYKTTLTWGVGVASRGKLRGLSLPIAKPESENGPAPKKEPAAQRRKSSVSSASNATAPSSWKASSNTNGANAARTFMPAISEAHPIKLESLTESNPTKSVPISIPQTQWHNTVFPTSNPYTQDSSRSSYSTSNNDLSLPSIQTSFGRSSIDGFSMSANSMTSYNSADFSTPTEYAQPPAAYPFGEPFNHFGRPSFSEHMLPAMLDRSMMDDRGQDSYPQEPISNMHGNQIQDESSATIASDAQQTLSNNMFSSQDATPGPFSHQDPLYADFEMALDDDSGQDQVLDLGETSDMTLSLPRSLFTTQFFHLSPRMQSLLDFYDKHICSVLVAFDGPANPYRTHILQLATHNEGLQNALAALATNNMRMRAQKQSQSIGFVEDENEDDILGFNTITRSSLSAPSPEESCYKALSIEQLNLQLTHPSAAQDDSVLGTLLILCLFHVCDSGFSKFKTQLAGVQKLLSLRKPNMQSGFIGWVEMFFTWFDVMTSTVNDRETQIKGENLAMLDYSANLGALEQFSGCDGRLFKLIARLGRLNLLSQDRPVRGSQTTTNKRKSSSRPADPREMHKRFKPRPFNPADFDRLDGNGWGAPISDSDDEATTSLNAEHDKDADTRHEFWTEWHDIRSRLQSWSMDYSSIPAPPSPTGGQSSASPSNPLGPEQRDLVHINESFRSSALLYTERLASPHLPSSAPCFQNLVSQALFHITALSITSCVNKFLLWPLFIIGTECVDEGHRANVRQRCVEIQRESGFFNNLSVLEVLERVWRETGTGMEGGEVEEVRRRRRDSISAKGGRYGQAFRWRRAMDRVDGEYIIV